MTPYRLRRATSLPRSHRSLLACALLPLLTGCATLGQIRALEDVDFAISGIREVRLAGVDLAGVSAFRELSLSDGATIANAWRNQELTLAMELEVRATNPAENTVDARLVRMDWTLLLEDTETIEGYVAEEILIPRGGSTTFPIVARLNLVDFFGGNAQDLVELTLSLAGLGGEPKDVELRALPVVQTIFGPITYSEPIRIVRATVGE